MIVSISFVLAKVITTLLKEFYTSVISSEVVCVNFLQDNALLGESENCDPCQKFGTQMAQKRQKTRAGKWVPMLCCLKKGCQMMCTLREGFAFQLTDLNSRVNSKPTLYQIMELLFMFVIEMPIGKTVELTGRVEMTVTAWFEMCCTVCTSILVERGKMVGCRKAHLNQWSSVCWMTETQSKSCIRSMQR